jgi:hypothetical protein
MNPMTALSLLVIATLGTAGCGESETERGGTVTAIPPPPLDNACGATPAGPGGPQQGGASGCPTPAMPPVRH